MPETLICIPGAPRLVNGEYATACYTAEGRGTTPQRATPLVALVELYKPASLIVLCTPEARRDTLAAYEVWLQDAQLQQQPELQVVDIKLEPGPDGIAALLGQISALTHAPDHRVHLDLTFGPRSVTILAMLSSLLQLAAGRWSISRLTYVNFEARPGGHGSSEPVPIEDLTSYLALPALATAVANLKERGDIAGFARALRKLPGTDASALPDKDLAALEEAITYLRILPLAKSGAGGSLGRLRKALVALKASPSAGLAGPLLGEAESVLDGLRPPAGTQPESPAHFRALVQWYRAHGQPDRALLLASEALAYMACTTILQKAYPIVVDGSSPPRHWQARQYFEEACEVPLKASARRAVESAYECWEALHRIRGDYAHASFTSKPGKPVVQAGEVAKILVDFEQVAQAFQALV